MLTVGRRALSGPCVLVGPSEGAHPDLAITYVMDQHLEAETAEPHWPLFSYGWTLYLLFACLPCVCFPSPYVTSHLNQDSPVFEIP